MKWMNVMLCRMDHPAEVHGPLVNFGARLAAHSSHVHEFTMAPAISVRALGVTHVLFFRPLALAARVS